MAEPARCNDRRKSTYDNTYDIARAETVEPTMLDQDPKHDVPTREMSPSTNKPRAEIGSQDDTCTVFRERKLAQTHNVHSGSLPVAARLAINRMQIKR